MRNINLNVFKAELKTKFTKERYLEIVDSFKTIAKKAKSHKCESSMELYVLNALIRGRSVTKTTHNVSSLKYKTAEKHIYDYLNGKEYRSQYSLEGRIPYVLDEAFGLTKEEKELIYITAIKSKEFN